MVKNDSGLKKMNVSVTIGLCVRNSGETIQSSIDSIISQNYPSELVQLIIVDGCSSDNTLSIIAGALSKTTLKTETYSDGGRGLGAARQTVVSKSIAKYIVFADGDVTLFPDFVMQHVRYMEENPGAGVAFAKDISKPTSNGTLVSNVAALFNYAEEYSRGSAATIFRVDAVKQAGGFDVNITGAAEDIDLIARIQARGWLISTNRNARFLHKHRERLGEFWREYAWFGYGSHYFNHKNKNAMPAWRNLPIGYLFFTLKTARKSYRLTFQKISFLIPVQMMLGNISWWFGFTNAHIAGYGHRLVPEQVCSGFGGKE
jgi:glycosyltransferase involved in cell wall biosynthesis